MILDATGKAIKSDAKPVTSFVLVQWHIPKPAYDQLVTLFEEAKKQRPNSPDSLETFCIGLLGLGYNILAPAIIKPPLVMPVSTLPVGVKDG